MFPAILGNLLIYHMSCTILLVVVKVVEGQVVYEKLKPMKA